MTLCFNILTVFPVTPALTAPVPTVTLVPSTTSPFIGSSITVSFDNTGPAGNTGYGPFIDLIFPSHCADGDPGAGEALDGITFTSAPYAGQPLSLITLKFPETHGCLIFTA
jgi:hypothetical protein